MSRLTDKQIVAVVRAVETLCDFALADTGRAIRGLCELDPSILSRIAEDYRPAVQFVMPEAYPLIQYSAGKARK